MWPQVCTCCLALRSPIRIVVHHKSALRLLILGVTAVSLAAFGHASKPVTPSPTVEFVYHSLIPLGVETFSVKPWNAVLTILASAENPEFEGWRAELYQTRRRLLDGAGRPVRYYPDQVEFRILLSTRSHLLGDDPFPLRATLPINDYLKQVRFRMKIFHGLRQTIVPASSVTMIGVPEAIPYNERIYSISFDLDDIPMSDRIILEVLAPSGERLCKFHLDL